MIEFLSYIWDWLLAEFEQHTMLSVAALYAVFRLLGTTVHTGELGVKYTFGRVRGLAEPGFYWLFPVAMRVRIVESRSRTLDCSPQRVTTRDGLVYNMEANLVYRIIDPIKALVRIKDYQMGCATALALSVQEVVSAVANPLVSEPSYLRERLQDNLASRLERWGIEIQSVDFISVSPSQASLKITQLRTRVEENRKTLEWLRSTGLPEPLVLGLLGSRKRLVSKSGERYRNVSLRRPRKLIVD